MVIGVTGNSGAGKSFLVQNIKSEVYIIDADKIGHSCLKIPECKSEILEVFGDLILDDNNEINRKQLGSIVFKDKQLLDKLTKISHKYILIDIDKKIESKLKDNIKIIIDAPLLFEANLDKKCDYTILVKADYENKIRQIIERDKISLEIAKARLDKQAKDEEVEKKVNIVFENKYKIETINNFNSIIENMEYYG